MNAVNIGSPLSLEYDFTEREATVIYPPGTEVDTRKLIAYFEETTDSKVEIIFVHVGKDIYALARDSTGVWTMTADEASRW